MRFIINKYKFIGPVYIFWVCSFGLQAQGSADLDEIAYISSIDGRTYAFKVSACELLAESVWLPQTKTSPPLEIGDAIACAKQDLHTYVGQTSQYRLQKISFVPCIVSNSWVYKVGFIPIEQTIREEGSNIMSNRFEIVVLLSGRVIKGEEIEGMTSPDHSDSSKISDK